MTLVVIGPDVLERLRAFVTRPALVVMDANTREAFGDRVVEALGAEACCFEQRDGLLAGLGEAEHVQAGLRAGSVPVAVGSGVITDIVRFAADRAGCDFISVPTAASMDGYASSGAAMQIDGVKVTFETRAPAAIFADPAVAARAPIDLTRAGIGDLLGKASARVDWLAAHLLYGEEYSSEVADRMLSPLDTAASSVDALLRGSAEAVKVLLEGLVQSGLAMAAAGSSRPASGSEHHASHFWDLLAARGEREHASHGLQVGYATRFAMRLQRHAYGGAISRLREPRPIADAPGWMGESDAVAEAVRGKREFVARGFVRPWPLVVDRLRPELARFDEVERALDACAIPSEPGWLGISEDMLGDAFRFGSRLRARYTVVDFLEGQGRLEEAIGKAINPRSARDGTDR